jgi:hypothetical protein
VIEVDAIEATTVGALTAHDAVLAGFASREELVAYLDDAPSGPTEPSSPVYAIALKHVGDGDRVPIAMFDALDAEAVASISAALARLDADGPWTRATLELIAAEPKVAASRLAATLGRETAPFKADVVKLKKLGLTQSFEIGYELSPRGAAYLARSSSTLARTSAVTRRTRSRTIAPK